MKKLPLIPKKRRLRSLVFFLVVLCYLSMSKAHLLVSASSDCGSRSKKTVVSPDKAWNAVITEYYCFGDYAFESSATYVVTMVSRSNLAQPVTIYAISDDGDPQDQPIVSWVNVNTLQISTIKDPDDTLHSSSFGNIKISYVYRTYRNPATPQPTPAPTLAPTPLPTLVPTSTPTLNPTPTPPPFSCPTGSPTPAPSPSGRIHPTQNPCA